MGDEVYDSLAVEREGKRAAGARVEQRVRYGTELCIQYQVEIIHSTYYRTVS
jgi:hypothetical protein